MKHVKQGNSSMMKDECANDSEFYSDIKEIIELAVKRIDFLYNAYLFRDKSTRKQSSFYQKTEDG